METAIYETQGNDLAHDTAVNISPSRRTVVFRLSDKLSEVWSTHHISPTEVLTLMWLGS